MATMLHFAPPAHSTLVFQACQDFCWIFLSPTDRHTNSATPSAQSVEFFDRLGFVRLLARANEIVDGFGGFGALPLLKFTHPARDGIDHVAGRLTRGLWFGRLSLSTFGALYDFYYFFL